MYVLEEKMLDADFQNLVIDKTLEHLDYTMDLPLCSMIEETYQGTPAGSPARQLLVDAFCDSLPIADVDAFVKDMRGEFVGDCMKLFMKMRSDKSKRPWIKYREKYQKKGTKEVNEETHRSE